MMCRTLAAVGIFLSLGWLTLGNAAGDGADCSACAAPTTTQPSADRRIEELSLDLGDGVKLEMVLIPPGEFIMGRDGDRDAKPAHKVSIGAAFYLGKYEVTQEQWNAVMGSPHSRTTHKGEKLPVDTVEWWEGQDLCAKLSAKFPGKRFTLPTEAQWEYACRAGSTTAYSFGDDPATLGDYAWFHDNSGGKENQVAGTHPVGQKKPNAWGLYDMHGNVWEWCQTAWKPYPYAADDGREVVGPRTEPAGKKDPRSMIDAKVVRGGSWHQGAKACTSFSRAASTPADHRYYYGVRLAMSVER